MEKTIGIIGLGKMGGNLAVNLLEKGYKVYGYNRTKEKTEGLTKNGLIPSYSIKELLQNLPSPKIVILMLTAGEIIDEFLRSEDFKKNLSQNDYVLDFANSNYKDTKKRYEYVHTKFVDVGISGGPSGARNGACLMIGGSIENFTYLEPVYRDISAKNAYMHFEGDGAGHFVKMVHNGIEYGMMQAIAEGYDVLKNSEYKLNLYNVSKIYNNKSVIESRLINWTKESFEEFGNDLEAISGSAGQGGEGAGNVAKGEADWTIDCAKELNIEAKVIEESIKARAKSRQKPSFQGKVINAIRNKFGGHRAY